MEKKRVEKGEKYWCVGEDMNPLEAVCGENWTLDVLRFKAGNCYTDYHECYVMCGKLRAVLNGADVIQLPSEEEFNTGEETYIQEGYSEGEYCHEQSFCWGFQEGIEWLISKITK